MGTITGNQILAERSAVQRIAHVVKCVHVGLSDATVRCKKKKKIPWGPQNVHATEHVLITRAHSLGEKNLDANVKVVQ